MRQLSAATRRIVTVAVCAAALAIGTSVTQTASTGAADKNERPKIKIKATPVVSFAPSRVVVTVEVSGGPNDFEEFYCATVEWDWGDGTKAESKTDCDPYEAGKSEIKRRYTYDRIFRTAGDYNVEFRLKQKNRTVGSARTSIKVRPGLSDGFYDR